MAGSNRHCEPTDRANAHPMTGSAKQSMVWEMKGGLLRRCAPRNDDVGLFALEEIQNWSIKL
jgi:hypothetical protein